MVVVKFKDIEKIVLSLGYVLYSQRGSHIKYKLDEKTLIICNHKTIAPGTLNSIIKIISEHTGITKKSIKEMLK